MTSDTVSFPSVVPGKDCEECPLWGAKLTYKKAPIAVAFSFDDGVKLKGQACDLENRNIAGLML